MQDQHRWDWVMGRGFRHIENARATGEFHREGPNAAACLGDGQVGGADCSIRHKRFGRCAAWRSRQHASPKAKD
jgi:hypothetical protein